MKNFWSVFLTILKMLFGVSLFLMCLFGSAGTVYWLEAWIFLGLYFIFLILFSLWLKRKDPELLKERTTRRKEGKKWDKLLLAIYSLFILMLFAVCGLDAVRYHWTQTSVLMKVIGFLGLILNGALIFWTVVVNRYLSAVVRIQSDRDHYVISDGPYQYVRHPMYVGIILFFLAVPPALGSLYGLIFSGLIMITYLIRTHLEDKTLQQELPGYLEYTKKVRYRLFPGVW